MFFLTAFFYNSKLFRKRGNVVQKHPRLCKVNFQKAAKPFLFCKFPLAFRLSPLSIFFPKIS